MKLVCNPIIRLRYLTLDRARRGVLILSSDTSSISDSILVGGWISLPLSHPINSDSTYPLGPAVWQILMDYVFKLSLNRYAMRRVAFIQRVAENFSNLQNLKISLSCCNNLKKGFH